MPRDAEFNYTASDKTGPASESVRRRMKQTGDDAEKQSNRISNVIGKGIVQIAETVSPKLAKSLANAFASTGEVGPALLVGGIVAAAPLIGATVSGAIIGGVGSGGVIGGFLVAAKDPRVQAAATAMKADIAAELKTAAVPFVETSLTGIRQIGGAVKKIDFKQIFADSAVNAVPLIDGTTDAVDKLGKAIADIVHGSGPVMTEIGHEISAFSGAIAGGLESIADNGPQGAEALRQIFLVINGTVSATFALVNGLTEVYGAMSKITNGGPTALLDSWAAASASVADKTRGMAEALINANGAVDANGQAILTDGAAIATFTQQVDALASAGHSLFDSTTQVGEAINKATAAAKKNGKTLDANTEKGRENRSALSSLASALVAQTKATADAGASQEQLNSVAGTARARFIKLATAFGRSGTEAAALATKMGLIPAKKKTEFTAKTHDAEARVQALKDKIDGIHGKTVTIDVKARMNKVNNTLDRLGAGFDARDSFLFARGNGQDVRSRTEAPRQIDVNSTASVTVLLDGKPFRAIATQAASEAVDRAVHRQKVGRR